VSRNVFSSRGCPFENIVGNDDIKLILNKATLSEQRIHIHLVGKPGCAKTMLLTYMMDSIKESYLIVGSNSTKAGLVNQRSRYNAKISSFCCTF
jgi:Mg-chelatase subunit ChlI